MILYGASGHGKVIKEIIEANGEKVEAFVDDNLSLNEYCGKKVLHNADGLDDVIVSIGNNAIRKKVVQKLTCHFGVAIHPTAVVSPSARIGEGTVVMAGAVINAGAIIGGGVENSVIEAGNIYLAMSESKKYMAYEELDCLFQFELKGSLPLKQGLLLYDFFEEFLEGYIINGGLDVVARVYETQETYELSFVVDGFEPWMEPWLEYEKEYLNIDSEIKCKDLGYAFNLTLCLPKEEVKA